MSVTKPRAGRDRYGQPTDVLEIEAQALPSSAAVDVVVMHDGANRQDAVWIQEFIARVLERAHATAMASDNADEARAIFHVAMSFAEEFETSTPEFDRLRFLHAATGV